MRAATILMLAGVTVLTTGCKKKSRTTAAPVGASPVASAVPAPAVTPVATPAPSPSASAAPVPSGPCLATLAQPFHLRAKPDADAKGGKAYPAATVVEVSSSPDLPMPPARATALLYAVKVQSDGATGFAFVNPWELDDGCLAAGQIWLHEEAAGPPADPGAYDDLALTGVHATAAETLKPGSHVFETVELDADHDGTPDQLLTVAATEDEMEHAVILAHHTAAGWRAHYVGYNGGGSEERFEVTSVTSGDAVYFLSTDEELCPRDEDCSGDSRTVEVFRLRGDDNLVRVALIEDDTSNLEPAPGEGLTFRSEKQRHTLAWDAKRWLLVAR
jgi:hypothetical protein